MDEEITWTLDDLQWCIDAIDIQYEQKVDKLICSYPARRHIIKMLDEDAKSHGVCPECRKTAEELGFCDWGVVIDAQKDMDAQQMIAVTTQANKFYVNPSLRNVEKIQ